MPSNAWPRLTQCGRCLRRRGRPGRCGHKVTKGPGAGTPRRGKRATSIEFRRRRLSPPQRQRPPTSRTGRPVVPSAAMPHPGSARRRIARPCPNPTIQIRSRTASRARTNFHAERPVGAGTDKRPRCAMHLHPGPAPHRRDGTQAGGLKEAGVATPGFPAQQWTGYLTAHAGSDPVHQGSSAPQGQTLPSAGDVTIPSAQPRSKPIVRSRC